MILQTCDLSGVLNEPDMKDVVGNVHRRHRKAVTGWTNVEHPTLRKALPDDYAFARPTSSEPISVPTGYSVKTSKRTEVQGTGVAIIEAVLHSEAMPYLPPFVVLNVVYPPKTKHSGDERDAVLAAHTGRLAYWHNRGYTVFWTGQTNGAVGRKRLHGSEKSLLTVKGQQIRVVVHPEGVQAEPVTTGTTDPDAAHWVRIRLLRPRATPTGK